MAKQPTARFSSASELARAATAVAALPQSPTRFASAPSQPSGTRQFPPQWPNPAGPGYTPYSEPTRASEPVREQKLGRGRLILALAAAAAFGAAALIAGFLISRNSNDTPQGPDARVPATLSSSETTSELSATTARPPTNSPPPAALPGTDAQGFVDYPAARRHAGSTPAVMARTTQSVLVVCEVGPASYYHRGVRVSHGAGIELANAVRSSGGFDVTNTAPTEPRTRCDATVFQSQRRMARCSQSRWSSTRRADPGRRLPRVTKMTVSSERLKYPLSNWSSRHGLRVVDRCPAPLLPGPPIGPV